jgi:hypothetical protein
MSLLEYRKLWFSRMDEFEDPLEGTFTDFELKYLEKFPVVRKLLEGGTTRVNGNVGHLWKG